MNLDIESTKVICTFFLSRVKQLGLCGPNLSSGRYFVKLIFGNLKLNILSKRNLLALVNKYFFSRPSLNNIVIFSLNLSLVKPWILFNIIRQSLTSSSESSCWTIF